MLFIRCGTAHFFVGTIDGHARDPKAVKSPLELELWCVRRHDRTTGPLELLAYFHNASSKPHIWSSCHSPLADHGEIQVADQPVSTANAAFSIGTCAPLSIGLDQPTCELCLLNQAAAFAKVCSAAMSAKFQVTSSA